MIMSSTLMWKPVTREGESLPYELKKTISRKLWDTDGSCGGSALLDSKIIPYLEGLRDANVKGAKALIDAINKHGEIKIWHEY